MTVRDRVKNAWDFTCFYDIIHSYTSTKLDSKKNMMRFAVDECQVYIFKALPES